MKMDIPGCCQELSTQTPIHWASDFVQRATDSNDNTTNSSNSVGGQKQFANEKKQTLTKMDKSVKGEIDAPIIEMVGMINNSDNYYTTSSCSGRIIVTASSGDNEATPVVKKGTDWQFVSHESINVDQFLSTIRSVINKPDKVHDSMILKFEPVIFHIRAADIEAARQLLQVGLQSGFRNSGIVLAAKGRATVAFRSTASIEVPLIVDGELVVTDDYVQQLVKVANRKMASNLHAINRLQESLKQFFKL